MLLHLLSCTYQLFDIRMVLLLWYGSWTWVRLTAHLHFLLLYNI